MFPGPHMALVGAKWGWPPPWRSPYMGDSMEAWPEEETDVSPEALL